MKAKLAISAFSLMALTSFSQVVPNIDFITYPPSGGTREMIDNVPSALDITNNAEYISGYTRSISTLRDYLLIKYDLSGNIVWQRSFDYAGLNDRALAIAIDNSGNIIITGEATSLSNGTDIVTRKYDINGNLIWSNIVNGSANANDKGLGVTTDNSGDVYVCGYISNTGTGSDFAVVKYNSAGVQQYIYTKNGTANSNDAANAIAFFGNRIYVTGNLTNTVSGADIYTTRLNANNASVNWSKTENGSANLNDQSLDIKIQGNDVLICGGVTNAGTNQDYFFAKYNATNGIAVFTKTYDAFGGDDFATSLILDASNTYAITGMAKNGTNYDYHTTKYDNAGNLTWVNKHLTNANFTNVFPKISVDNIANHFYVSGVKFNSTIDASVYQITPGGNESWSDYFDGFGMRDAHVDLSVDNFGRIYLATLSEKAPNIFDIALIRYSQTPVFFPPDPSSEPPSNMIQYYKNTNLVLNTSGIFESSVQYFTLNHNTYDFIRKDGISHVFARLDTTTADQDSLEKVDINFKFPNEFTKQYDFEPNGDITNFYYAHTAPNGVSVKGARRVMEPNLWSGVDLHYYTNNVGLKYYFVVKPGTDPSVIQMNVTNASLSLSSGALRLTNSFGEINYEKPEVYQVGPIGNIIPVGFTPTYSISGSDVSFTLGTYNPALPLVIMMSNAKAAASPSAIKNLTWSTLYGGGGDDIFYDVKTNISNHVWVTGRTASSNFPVASAYQGTNGGSYDAVFLKFNNFGVRQWATYIGGTADDTDPRIHGIEVDPSGNCFSAFGTTSTNFPLLNPGGGAYFDNVNSTALPFPATPKDVAIVSFNNAGGLMWSTYFGGSPNTATSFDIGLDNFNNLVVTGLDGGFPIITPVGAYNSPFAAGSSGAYFIAKFNTNRQLIWSTHFGVNGPNIERIAFNSSNELFIVGTVNTTSPSYDFINPGGGAYFVNTPQGGQLDGHIAKFNSSNNLVWSTWYGGTGDDKIHGITIDGSNNVYLSGESMSGSGFIAGNSFGINNTSYSGNGSIFTEVNGDGFLSKFSSSGQKIADTYFGGTSNDGSFNIYSKGSDLFTCFQTGSNDMPFYGSNPINGFVQAVNNDGHDVAGDGYFTMLDNNFNFKWSSYFGGNPSAFQAGDAIYSNCATNDNKYYIVGYTSSTANFPLVNPGAGASYQSTKASAVDGFIAQFDLVPLSVGIGINEVSQYETSISLYPNPAREFVYLINSNSGKYIIEIVDVSGRLIRSLSASETKIKLNISDVAQGAYFIKIYNSEYSIVKKLIID